MVSPLSEESVPEFPETKGEISLPKWMQNFIENFYDKFLDELSTCFSNIYLTFALSIISSVRPYIKSEGIYIVYKKLKSKMLYFGTRWVFKSVVYNIIFVCVCGYEMKILF